MRPLSLSRRRLPGAAAIGASFDLRGVGTALFDGPAPWYPEIRFVA